MWGQNESWPRNQEFWVLALFYHWDCHYSSLDLSFLLLNDRMGQMIFTGLSNYTILGPLVRD